MKLAFFLGIAAACGSLPAQTAGTFTATGSMTTPREMHTATLLFDGQVLLTGGYSIEFLASTATNSAELYDLSRGTFAATGTMAAARYGHTATRLPDGRVLIAGGYDTKGYSLNSAEIYDPATGAFTPSANMTTGRSLHTATLLQNGKVLIAGGVNDPGSLGDLSTAELYDPASGTFTTTGTMNIGRAWHKATLMANGQVLIVPGSDGADYQSAELYDPVAGTFNTLSFVNPGNLVAATVNLLPSGRALTTLTVPECDVSARQTSLYNPAAAMFTAGANMTSPHCDSAGVQLSDGGVLIVGSIQDGVGPNPGADVYDAAVGTFSPAGPMVTAHNYHRATLLQSGDVLVTGGVSATAELYHPPSALPAPVLLTVGAAGQAAVLHAATQQLVSASNPAVTGEALEIFCTGLIEGSAIPPQVAIGGQMAQVLFFGDAPGYSGLNQVNVTMPGNVSGAASMVLTYLERASNAVTANVQ
jgi:hypothetical protein